MFREVTMSLADKDTPPYRRAAERSESFPLENILTASARDYCQSVGRELGDYEMRGIVNVSPGTFAQRVPPNTEVVVDYMTSSQADRSYASGTALIPRTK